VKATLKHLFSLILPVTVLIIVPFCIEKRLNTDNLYALYTGLLIMCLGLSVMALAISLFIRIGKGTLAPWSPTKKLIIRGIYCHVRNPMIIGVLIVLIGEAVAILSLNIFIWAVAFFISNNIYFYLYEEPDLNKKFGKEYNEYKKNVPRWIPSMKPYSPNSELR
jgi:protein-S-isoprenylcysteine O-methyltransferase Ste14